MAKKKITRKSGKPPKLCPQYLGDDYKGRGIYCNHWLDDKGRCPVHGQKG